ncbi:hypothetical protein D3C71_1848250 [compost metagenome]
MRAGSTEFIQLREFARVAFRQSLYGAEIVRAAEQTTFGARSIVADDVDEHRVVELAVGLECIDQLADLDVGMFQKTGINLHQSRSDALLIRGQRVPCWHSWVS